MGGKNSRNNFSRTTQIVRARYVGTKFVWKKCEKTFFNSHEYRDQKMGGKKPAKNFFQNTRIVLEKMLEKKSSEKSAKKRFL